MSASLQGLTAQIPTALVIFDIDGVVRDVSGSYRRAIADTVEHFTKGRYRPAPEDIDALKAEGCWNNDWEASKELIEREATRSGFAGEVISYGEIIEFFQAKYRGTNFSGYIQDEPLLMSQAYLAELTEGGIAWGFFSGATRASASYILETRLGLVQPLLVAMEDAPSKPNPAGLFAAVEQLAQRDYFSWNPHQSLGCPIVYVGDTVADMQTIRSAQQTYPNQNWIAVGVIPPHVKSRTDYAQLLRSAGARQVLETVQALSPSLLADDLMSQTDVTDSGA